MPTISETSNTLPSAPDDGTDLAAREQGSGLDPADWPELPHDDELSDVYDDEDREERDSPGGHGNIDHGVSLPASVPSPSSRSDSFRPARHLSAAAGGNSASDIAGGWEVASKSDKARASGSTAPGPSSSEHTPLIAQEKSKAKKGCCIML